MIEGAVRDDEGIYTINVTNPSGEDKAELFVKIVGRWIFVLVCFHFFLRIQTVKKVLRVC